MYQTLLSHYIYIYLLPLYFLMSDVLIENNLLYLFLSDIFYNNQYYCMTKWYPEGHIQIFNIHKNNWSHVNYGNKSLIDLSY